MTPLKGMTLPTLKPYEVVFYGENKQPFHRVSVEAFSEDEAKASVLANYWKSWGPQSPAKIARIEVLSDVHIETGRRQQTLFEDMADVCIGHTLKDIQGACVNLLMTAVRRRYDKKADASARWDELMGRAKEALLNRYAKKPEDAGEDAARSTEIANRILS